MVKKTVRAKGPAAKTITSKKEPSQVKPLALKKEERVQTAEGWKRDMIKTRKTKKTS
jgi:hypothetical protein